MLSYRSNLNWQGGRKRGHKPFYAAWVKGRFQSERIRDSDTNPGQELPSINYQRVLCIQRLPIGSNPLFVMARAASGEARNLMSA